LKFGKNLGKENFKNLKALKEKNSSPSPKNNFGDQAEIELKLEFCHKKLKIHKENMNNVMIGFVTAEIKDLEKKLK